MLAGHDPAYVRTVWLVASAVGAVALALFSFTGGKEQGKRG